MLRHAPFKLCKFPQVLISDQLGYHIFSSGITLIVGKVSNVQIIGLNHIVEMRPTALFIMFLIVP